MPDSKPAYDIAGYAAAVRVALASLPDAERENLLEDLEGHLAEVASESDQPLEERLGTPQAYAAELRSAYGVGTEPVNRRRRRLFRDRSRSFVKGALGTPAYRELSSLVAELRPGWWILRAYLAVLFLAFVFRDGGNLRPIPNPFSSSGLLQIVATLLAIVISVRLGRRGMPVNRGWRWAGVAANVVIAVIALPVLVSMGTGSNYISQYDSASDPYFSSVSAGYYPGFTNIYPYSRDGKPLTGVLLYDQDGRPLVPGKSELVVNVPNGADGLPIPNAYPLDERDLNGAPVVPPRVALPPAANTASASPTPTPSP